MRKLTGFDRVIIYQFDCQWNGHVIAEDKVESLDSLLGLHYRASDIPKQVRMYYLNSLRLIADADNIEIVPTCNPVTNRALDLSQAILRSTSPLDIEYLHKMGVTAYMSLIKEGELWGLMTCHHQSPKRIPYEARTACEFIGQLMSLGLSTKSCNDELAKVNVELAQSNSELDWFAHIASHDLKEPLRGIHNYSCFLLEDYAHKLDENAVSKLNVLIRLTQHMEDLIDSLLHFSQVGRLDLYVKQTDLNVLVKHILEILSVRIEETKVDIRIPRPLPRIRCDRVRVGEVFKNLIANAIKYNNKAEKWIEIGFTEPTSCKENETNHHEKEPVSPIIFYVRDNGIGIREKHFEAIFRIFKRLHGPDKYGGGTGFGLTLAKKIVERHGGSIWVESNFGEGTTFYFTLQS